MRWRALSLSSRRNTRKPLGRSMEHEAAWSWTHIPLKSLKRILERLMAAPHKTPEKLEWIHLPREKQWSWALYGRSYGERAENSTHRRCHPSTFLTIQDDIAADWNSLHPLSSGKYRHNKIPFLYLLNTELDSQGLHTIVSRRKLHVRAAVNNALLLHWIILLTWKNPLICLHETSQVV